MPTKVYIKMGGGGVFLVQIGGNERVPNFGNRNLQRARQLCTANVMFYVIDDGKEFCKNRKKRHLVFFVTLSFSVLPTV